MQYISLVLVESVRITHNNTKVVFYLIIHCCCLFDKEVLLTTTLAFFLIAVLRVVSLHGFTEDVGFNIAKFDLRWVDKVLERN